MPSPPTSSSASATHSASSAATRVKTHEPCRAMAAPGRSRTSAGVRRSSETRSRKGGSPLLVRLARRHFERRYRIDLAYTFVLADRTADPRIQYPQVSLSNERIRLIADTIVQ